MNLTLLRLVLVLTLLMGCGVQAGHAAEKVRFLLDWKAEAEQGGYFQALATGLYKKHGLDVTLMEGGPGFNNQQMIAAGAVDMAQLPDDVAMFNLVKVGAPVQAVMASFQKTPLILMTHPRADIKSLADMKGKPVMIADGNVTAYFMWLKSKYGLSNAQIRKYNNNYGPFLADKSAIVQGYVTNSPLLIEKAGSKPQVFLLADYGYPSYGAIVAARQGLIAAKPQVVQAFIDATIEGWYSYLYGDPRPALALIKHANPDMTDEINAYVLQKLRQYQFVDGGDTKTLGIGAMTASRWKAMFDIMVAAKAFAPDMDYAKAFTLQFVNKKHAMPAGH